MNSTEMKKKLDGTDYDFLRKDYRLGDNIILLTTGGSYAYGTNINTKGHVSDFDVRGIFLNSKEELLTMNCFNKPIEDKLLDCTIYPLKQIIELLSNSNPNVLEMLGTKEEHLFVITKEGQMLRENANLFLSKRAYKAFGGYAIQQLRRLQNALARDSYMQPEKEVHILGSINKQILTFEDRYNKLADESLKLYIDKSSRKGFENEIYIDMNLKHYPLRDLKGMYSEMSQVINDYDKLNHRNSKKDELHLLKHAMHLIRLLKMGTEILQGKGIKTYREKDRKQLLQIRNGEYSYENIFEMVDKLKVELEYAYKNSALPETPDYKKINELVMEINKAVLER